MKSPPSPVSPSGSDHHCTTAFGETTLMLPAGALLNSDTIRSVKHENTRRQRGNASDKRNAWHARPSLAIATGMTRVNAVNAVDQCSASTREVLKTMLTGSAQGKCSRQALKGRDVYEWVGGGWQHKRRRWPTQQPGVPLVELRVELYVIAGRGVHEVDGGKRGEVRRVPRHGTANNIKHNSRPGPPREAGPDVQPAQCLHGECTYGTRVAVTLTGAPLMRQLTTSCATPASNSVVSINRMRYAGAFDAAVWYKRNRNVTLEWKETVEKKGSDDIDRVRPRADPQQLPPWSKN